MSKRILCVYRIYWPTGSKRAQQGYVGKTVDLLQRVKDHAKNNGSPLVKAALKKYGKPEIEIWECSSEENAFELEKQKIKELGTLVPKGYNRTEGGGGFTSELSRRINSVLTPKQLQQHKDRVEKSRHSLTTEQRRENAYKAELALTDEQRQKRRDRMIQLNSSKTPKQRKELSHKASEISRLKTVEQYREVGLKAYKSLTIEQRKQQRDRLVAINARLTPEQHRQSTHRARTAKLLKSRLPNWNQMTRKLKQKAITEFLEKNPKP